MKVSQPDSQSVGQLVSLAVSQEAGRRVQGTAHARVVGDKQVRGLLSNVRRERTRAHLRRVFPLARPEKPGPCRWWARVSW